MGWLHRRRSGHGDRHRYTTRRFGRATVTVDVERQTVEVVGDATPAEREEITVWAREQFGIPLEHHDRVYARIWQD